MNRKPTKTSRFPWPWWISVLIAALLYWFLRYQAPDLALKQPALANILSAMPAFAPVLTILLLLLAAAQLYENTEAEDEPDEPDDPDDPSIYEATSEEDNSP